MSTYYNGITTPDVPDLDNIRRLDQFVAPCIMEMTTSGLTVDQSHLTAFGKFLDQELDRLEETVATVGGFGINVASSDQVADLLFHRIGIKQRGRIKMTPSGDRETTGKDVLESLRYAHPVVPYILEHREIAKLKGTYVDGILGRLDSNSVIYPEYSDTRVPSGRLACSDPNLMAVPKRTELGREIRKAFVARPGYSIVSIDQSQIEMRVACHESQCELMSKIYMEKGDVHKQTASRIFQVPVDELDSYRHRNPAKTLGFLVLFDGGAAALRDKITIACDRTWTPAQRQSHVDHWTEERCESLITDWYRLYPEIAERRLVHHTRTRRHGFVWCMFGRIRRGGGVYSRDKRVVSATLRELANIPMQSGAQGVMKLTMAECFDIRDRLKLDVRFLLQVHDELIMEVENSIVEDVEATFGDVFDNAVRLDIPLGHGSSHGPRWMDWSE